MKSKLFTLIAVSGLLAGLGVAPLSAQLTMPLTANIPFEFMVGGKTLPAGEYIVSPETTKSVLRIRNDDTNEGALVLTNSAETLNYSDQAKLIFHRYGNQYFLWEIWAPGANVGYEVPKSKAEREASQTASVRRENVTILAMR
jgi:hypothetical protein